MRASEETMKSLFAQLLSVNAEGVNRIANQQAQFAQSQAQKAQEFVDEMHSMHSEAQSLCDSFLSTQTQSIQSSKTKLQDNCVLFTNKTNSVNSDLQSMNNDIDSRKRSIDKSAQDSTEELQRDCKRLRSCVQTASTDAQRALHSVHSSAETINARVLSATNALKHTLQSDGMSLLAQIDSQQTQFTNQCLSHSEVLEHLQQQHSEFDQDHIENGHLTSSGETPRKIAQSDLVDKQLPSTRSHVEIRQHTISTLNNNNTTNNNNLEEDGEGLLRDQDQEQLLLIEQLLTAADKELNEYNKTNCKDTLESKTTTVAVDLDDNENIENSPPRNNNSSSLSMSGKVTTRRSAAKSTISRSRSGSQQPTSRTEI